MTERTTNNTVLLYDCTVIGDLIPDIANTRNLGSVLRPFGTIYGNVVGSVSDPIIDTNSVRYPELGAKDVRHYKSSANTLTFDDGAGGTVAVVIIGTLNGQSPGSFVSGPASVTADQLTVYSGSSGKLVKAVPITIDSTTYSYKNNSQVGSTEVLQTRANGDGFTRFSFNNYGMLSFGPGNLAADTGLDRVTPGELEITSASGYTGSKLRVETLTTTTIGTKTVADLVTGPASCTANSIPRQSGTTGEVLTTSGVTIDNSNNIAGAGSVTATSVITPSITNTAAISLAPTTDLNLTPGATGNVVTFLGSSTGCYRFIANDASPHEAIRLCEAGTQDSPYLSIATNGLMGYGTNSSAPDTYTIRNGVGSFAIYNAGLAATDTNLSVGQTTTYSAVQVQEVVAAAGANQAAATELALKKSWVYVTSGSGGIKFNAATPINTVVKIRNNTGSSVNLYPATGGQINALGTNNPFTMTAGSVNTFHFFTATQIYSW